MLPTTPAAAAPHAATLCCADGKRGTREQCLEAARQALGRGDSVLIDRTNVTQDQRRPFVRLAAQQGAQVGVGCSWHACLVAAPSGTVGGMVTQRLPFV